MTDNLPSDFVPGFTNERLTIIAQALLTECYTTDDDLQSKYDSGYSIGCTRFDRQKNKLKDMALDHHWLGITDPSNKLIMTIDGAPFRFTRDDYQAPKKIALTSVCETESQQIKKFEQTFQTEFNWGEKLDSGEESQDPVRWRFIVEVNESAEEDNYRDYEIYFVGYCMLDSPVCVWKLSEHTSGYAASTDAETVQAVSLEFAKTSLPVTDKGKKDNDKK